MRKFLTFAAIAMALALCTPLVAQNPAPGSAPSGPRRMTQGGSGPIRMLLITKAHAYEREPYYQMFDSMGADITWMHIDHPAAEAFMTPKYANRYDVALFCDMNGAQTELGRSKREPAPNNSSTRTAPKTSSIRLRRASEGIPGAAPAGKGLVFTHHSLRPGFTVARIRRVMGGAWDWGNSSRPVGPAPAVGILPDDAQRINGRRQVARLRRGWDGFDIIDESYSCRTTKIPSSRCERISSRRNTIAISVRTGIQQPRGWVKAAENSGRLHPDGPRRPRGRTSRIGNSC